jgi:hypothetical protein
MTDQPTNYIMLSAPPTKEVIRIDEEGFHYKGEFIADAGEAHRLMVEFLNQTTPKPEPVAPTDEEIEEWADASSEVPLEEMDPDIHGWRRCFTKEEFGASIRAALARWGTPAIEPVPVSERLPEPEDCDKQGHVWAWRVYRPQDDDDDGDFWMQIPAKWLSHIPFSSSWSHWLPANALPIPEATNV